MTRHLSDRTASRARAALATLAVLLLAALPATTAAAGKGATVVGGVQLAYGTCGDGGGYAMTGDLAGCWYITEFTPNPHLTDSKHNLEATGTELFDGWIGSLRGTFTTTFQYTAKMDGPWGTSAEIHGRCHHPVVAGSGTGDFVGITGELSFKDVVDLDPPYYPYWGNVRIPGGGTTAATVTRSLGTASSASLAASSTTTASSC